MNRALLAAAVLLPVLVASASADDRKIDFVKDVQPIFKASCVKCHQVDPKKPKKKPAAGFRLDDKASAFKGGKAGKDILPGDSRESKLYRLLNGPVTLEDGKDLDPMPKVKRHEKWKALPADQIETIRLWIDQGADWPAAK
ncbi:MAG: hypothetical protein KGJ84_14155 [Elusimicrobia bacterium]|nr:hypothetical protein [Elusimicrobiota bacterium]